MTRATLPIAAATVLLSTAAMAQTMPGMDMSGHGSHQHGQPPAPKPPAARKPTRTTPKPKAPARSPAPHATRDDDVDHGAMDDAAGGPADQPAMPDMDHGAMGCMRHGAMSGIPDSHAMAADDLEQVGTALPAGDKPAPAPPHDHYADRDYGAEAMASSRAALPADHGDATFSQVLLNIAEYQARKGRDGYRWDGEAWFGGDINRLTIKSEGEGDFGRRAERAEVQALYSRALDPYWNLQAGLRYDVRPSPSRAYATIGVEGLAPYWFEVEGALFLSDRGDVLARVEAWHDIRLAQRLILQPRAEVNLAAQDMLAQRVGSGASNAELDLRLRYEIQREFAPYVGVSWGRRFGDSARFARQAGEESETTSLVIGVRAWF